MRIVYDSVSITVQTTSNTHWARHNQKTKEKAKSAELKRPEQILKQRILMEKKEKKNRKKKGNKGRGKGSRGKGKGRS